ncbi:MAG TPA: CmcI family methyltransferase [Pyrinomonadaceae bacterium]|nr:CmcI family methyltransferase [Pyrinomonadaceae bacterium]
MWLKRMVRQSLRRVFYGVAPRSLLDQYLHLKMLRQARQLCGLRDSAAGPQSWMDALWRSPFFRPLQKRSEILRLLERVRELKPTAILEVGAAGGGTTFLLAGAAAPLATIITLDFSFNKSRQSAVKCFALAGQQMICLKHDSQTMIARRAVEASLKGRALDLLYLDGDHSYEGVKADFKLYSPLVRPGGMIVFHDIVEDYRTRYGIETRSYVGGVPRFWSEIKSAHAPVEEMIEDEAQDGYGIGVLRWSGKSTPND